MYAGSCVTVCVCMCIVFLKGVAGEGVWVTAGTGNVAQQVGLCFMPPTLPPSSPIPPPPFCISDLVFS